MSGYRATERPDTSTWGDASLDAYTGGLVEGERHRRGEHPGPDRAPRGPWEWGFHDGYHGIEPDGTSTEIRDIK